jgi:shikimate dehydrogenase
MTGLMRIGNLDGILITVPHKLEVCRHPLPFQPTALPPGCLVAEIIMKPAETDLLKVAAAGGYPVHRGLHMLREQLGFYVDFFGLPALR